MSVRQEVFSYSAYLPSRLTLHPLPCRVPIIFALQWAGNEAGIFLLQYALKF